MYTTQRPEGDKNIIVISCQKPRNHHLFKVMVARAGGRMQNPKDSNRRQEKQELRRMINEN